MIEAAHILNGIILEEQAGFTLGDLCQACTVHAEWTVSLVEEGILEPTGTGPAEWRFSGVQLRRAHVVRRLQQDLGINLAGAALAINLMDELESLRQRLAVLERNG